MRRPAAQVVRQRVSTTRTKPAPVRGWNARDAIASMNEADAVTLDNWFPSAADVMLRKGSAEHPWEGADRGLKEGWELLGPSAIPYSRR